MEASCYSIVSLESVAIRARISGYPQLKALIDEAIDACAQSQLPLPKGRGLRKVANYLSETKQLTSQLVTERPVGGTTQYLRILP